MKTANIDRETLQIFWKIWRISMKDATYNNIKSHKKPAFHPLFRRQIFGKTMGAGGGVKLSPHPPAQLQSF